MSSTEPKKLRRPSGAEVAEVLFWIHQGLDEERIAEQLEMPIELVRACAKRGRAKVEEPNVLINLAYSLSVEVVQEAKRRLADTKKAAKLTANDLARLNDIATRSMAVALQAKPPAKTKGAGSITLQMGSSVPPPAPNPPGGGGDRPANATSDGKPLKLVHVN